MIFVLKGPIIVYVWTISLVQATFMRMCAVACGGVWWGAAGIKNYSKNN